MPATFSSLALGAISLALGASCVDRGQDDKAAAPRETGGQTMSDAAIPDSPPVLPKAPLTGTHMDGDGNGYRPAGYEASRSTAPRLPKARSIELVLRSTPPGAIASIDGKPIGNTPAYWRGFADGQAHEYTFTKQGYSMARYRFVSTQSGVVHGSLKKLVVGSDVAAAREAK